MSADSSTKPADGAKKRNENAAQWDKSLLKKAEHFNELVCGAFRSLWIAAFVALELRQRFEKHPSNKGVAGWTEFCADHLCRNVDTVSAWIRAIRYCERHVAGFSRKFVENTKAPLPPISLVSELSAITNETKRADLHRELFSGEYGNPTEFRRKLADLAGPLNLGGNPPESKPGRKKNRKGSTRGGDRPRLQRLAPEKLPALFPGEDVNVFAAPEWQNAIDLASAVYNLIADARNQRRLEDSWSVIRIPPRNPEGK